MLKMTKALKGWLVANREIGEDATDDEFRLEAGKAIAEGMLTVEKFAELTVDEKSVEANHFIKRLDGMTQSIANLTKALLAKEVTKPDGEKLEKSEKKVGIPVTVVADKLPDMEKAVRANGSVEQGAGTDARVKGVDEIFSTTKSVAKWPTKGRFTPNSMAGQPAETLGRTLYEPSELDKALGGVWGKVEVAMLMPNICSPARYFESMPEIDKQLLHYIAEKAEWDDTVKEGEMRTRRGYPGGVKQLIDDAVSGGIFAAPIVFDDLVVETPRLYGELYPLVTEVALPRGRRVEGVSIGQFTGAWGGVDATNIALFNTAGYVAAFNTTVYRAQGAVVIGLDFINDSPINFQGTLSRQMGEWLLQTLDDVVATGNGTTQPQGVMNAAGTTAVGFGGTTTLGNYEGLYYGVHKREKLTSLKSSIVFCGTDTSYSRARGLNVTSADQRRLGGGETGQGSYDSYAWMGVPYKINESLTNQQIFFFVAKRYRMYRRHGFELRTSNEGATLIRANEILISFTARYGGQLERGACAAVTNTAPA